MTDTDDQEQQPPKDDPVAVAILDMLCDGKALTFKDMAMRLFEAKRKPKDRPDAWRKYMTAVKQQCVHLARQGRVDIVRKGQVADPDDFKGIVKVRLKQG